MNFWAFADRSPFTAILLAVIGGMTVVGIVDALARIASH